MSKYLEKLREAIFAAHGCRARHVVTNRVKEIFEGQLAWEGEVETFALIGHPHAKHCYAWGADNGLQFLATTVLEIPPVDSPSSAVTVAIASKARR